MSPWAFVLISSVSPDSKLVAVNWPSVKSNAVGSRDTSLRLSPSGVAVVKALVKLVPVGYADMPSMYSWLPV
jgi:hypothetical protein